MTGPVPDGATYTLERARGEIAALLAAEQAFLPMPPLHVLVERRIEGKDGVRLQGVWMAAADGSGPRVVLSLESACGTGAPGWESRRALWDARQEELRALAGRSLPAATARDPRPGPGL